MTIEIVGAVVIREGKLLLVNNRGNWALPGGKKETGEGDLECLIREIEEEFKGTKIIPKDFYKTFYGISPINKIPVSLNTYFCALDGEITTPSDPEEDISESRWVDKFSDYEFPELTSQVISALRSDRYLS